MKKPEPIKSLNEIMNDLQVQRFGFRTQDWGSLPKPEPLDNRFRRGEIGTGLGVVNKDKFSNPTIDEDKTQLTEREFDSPELSIKKVASLNAMKTLAKGTKWDVGNPEYYSSYTAKGPLYHIHDKKNNKRFLYHPSTKTLANVHDEVVKPASVGKHPALDKLFAEKFSNPVGEEGEKKSKSDKSGATSGDSDVRSPTSTDVRSPTSSKTSTDAYTAGNVTITGGAGSGDTSVHITQVPDNTKGAIKGRNITPDQKRAELGIDNEGDPSPMKAKLGKEPPSAKAEHKFLKTLR